MSETVDDADTVVEADAPAPSGAGTPGVGTPGAADSGAGQPAAEAATAPEVGTAPADEAAFEPTGAEAVDQVLANLGSLDGMSPEEQVAGYDKVHRQLHDILTGADALDDPAAEVEGSTTHASGSAIGDTEGSPDGADDSGA